MGVQKYNFNTTEVTAMDVEETTLRKYLWVGFAKNSNNKCILKKVSAGDFTQVYYEFELNVERINTIKVIEGNVFLAVEATTPVIGYRYDTLTPLSDSSVISTNSVRFETPADIAYNGNEVFYLMPGDIMGYPSSLHAYNLEGVFSRIIDLEETEDDTPFYNGISIASENGDLWILTNNAVSELIRVAFDSENDHTISRIL